MANIKELYNGGNKVDLTYEHVMRDDGSKSLQQELSSVNDIASSMSKLTQVGGVVTKSFSSAFTIAGLVKSDGTWDLTHYLTAYHTDYIDISELTKIEAFNLWTNFYPAVLYDENHSFLESISGKNVTIIPSEKPSAKYVVFQGESNQTIAYYKTYKDDGTITSLVKDVAVLKKGSINFDKKIVLNGDSLCNQLGLQLMNIAHSQGYELLNRTRGGENIIGNLTRAGGMLAQVKKAFTMPASGSVNVALRSAWMYSDGTYAETPYNWTPTNGQPFWIKNVKGMLHKLKMVAVIAYDSSHVMLQSYADGGNYTMPSGTAYIRVNINVTNSSGEPHVSINNAPIDIETLCSINGYIDENDAAQTDSNFKHSNYIAVSSTKLYFDGCATPDSYTFIRDSAGASFNVGVGTDCFDNRLMTDKKYPHIWFSGQNGGFKSASEYAKMTHSAASAFNEQYLVVTTHTSNCTDAIVNAATSEFGAKYFNVRSYLSGNAIYDALRYGLITDSSLQPSNWESVFLDSKGVHQNEKCAYLQAVQIWNKMVMLSMVDGDMVDSSEYYVSNTESKLQYWYYVPENGYGDSFPNL